jgi:outer membrane receptor protein involved in Fe transport
MSNSSGEIWNKMHTFSKEKTIACLFLPRTVFLRYWCFFLISLAIHRVGSQGTAAYAQSEVVPVSPSSQSENTATRLEEITVTAQRREESAQDVPISMEVFSAEELQDSNARRTTDLFEATPKGLTPKTCKRRRRYSTV